MTERVEDYTVICRGGLDSNRNYLYLNSVKPGSATELVNYEPSLYGGYRRIEGYNYFDETYQEVDNANAEGKILGIIIFNNEVYAMRKQQSGTTYKVYKYDSGSGWVAVTTGLTHNTSSGGKTINKIRWSIYNFGTEDRLIWVDGVNNATLFDGTNWTQASTSNGGTNFADAGGAQVLNAPRYVHIFENHIFLSGDPDYPGVIAHSAPLLDYDWTSSSGAGQLGCGFSVKQIHAWRDDLVVFGNTDISRIYVDSSSFVIKNVTKNVGCIASDSVVELGGDLYYLSRDGIRTYAGTAKINDVELEIQSKSIQQRTRDLVSQTPLDQVTSVIIRDKSQVRFFFNNSSVAANTTSGLLAGFVNYDGNLGLEWAELRGIRTSVVCSEIISGAEYILHGDYDGKVYRQETGNNFVGENITAIYSSPFLDFGSSMYRKLMREISIFIRPEGSVTLSTAIEFDWGKVSSINPSAYSMEDETAINSIYGEVQYAGSGVVYGGSKFPLLETPLEGSCYSVRVKITSSGTDAPYSVQGIIFSYSKKGRR